jgi:hypothetical protein
LPIFQVSDGSKAVVQFPGAHAGGQDLAIDVGDTPKVVTVKRDGTLLDEYDALEGISIAGSGIVAQSYGINSSMLTTSYALLDGTAYFVMVNCPCSCPIIGVKFIQWVQGVFTADNTNQVGLYSRSGGTLTLIASSSNNGNLWKGATDSIVAEPFSSPVDITPGAYWIGFVFNRSAVTTNPEIAAAPTVVTARCSMLDLPNSGVTYGLVAGGGSTVLPSSQAMSGLTSSLARPWLALY